MPAYVPESAWGNVPAAAIESARTLTVAIRATRNGPETGLTESGPVASASQCHLTNRTVSVPRSSRVRVEGTGVVIDRSGLILTNHHVIEGSTVIRAWVQDRGWVSARLIQADSAADLVVLAVEAEFPAAVRWSDVDELHVGQAVAALGYTPGSDPQEGPAVLRGRLTGLHRSLQSELDPSQRHFYGDLLESTVPLLQGHSGGPLIDRTGAVIGINTAAVTHQPSGRRTGYAIRASVFARSAVSELLVDPSATRPGSHGASVAAGTSQ